VKVTGKPASTLEFRRIVHRLEDGRLSSGPAEEAILRQAPADFVHVESLDRPGPVRVRASAEDGRSFEAVVRAGSPAAAAAWAKAGVKRITAAAEGLREMPLSGERAKRRLAAWRASGEASELPAAGAALAALAGDVEHALAAKPRACPMLSGMDGRPFVMEGLAERCAALIALAERERDLVLLDVLTGLGEEAHALATGGDVRRWTRAEARFWRSIDHLREAAGARLTGALGLAAELIELGAAAVECPAANEEELERRREAFEEESRRLQEALR
jgi:hypothetical protein